MRCRGLQWVSVVMILIGSGVAIRADDWSFSNNLIVCADPTAVAKLACRIHKEAIWAVAAQLVGLAKSHDVTIAPLRGGYPGAVESSIRESAATLTKDNVPVGDLQTSYKLQVILSALDAVAAQVSTALYGYDANSSGETKPPETADRALQTEAGLCGNAAEIF